VPQKSSSKPNSTADAEIFILRRLLLPQKPLTKIRSLGPKNHPRSPVLRLTLKSSFYVDYCCLRNRWRKLGPWTQKSSKKPSSTADADIFCKNKLLLTDKPLMKTEPLLSQNSSSKPSSIADSEIFIVHRLLLAQKPLTKTRTPEPKKASKKPGCTADADIYYAHRLLLTEK